MNNQSLRRRTSNAGPLIPAIMALLILLSTAAGATQSQATRAHSRAAGSEGVTPAPLFFQEHWQRHAGEPNEMTVGPSHVATPNLELQVHGLDAEHLMIAGMPGAPGYPVNLWSGLSTEPVAVLLRDKSRFVDLTGPAKIRWMIRTSGFHEVRPAIQLQDGTLLVGDHADASETIFVERDFAVADMRWMRLDPRRVVTIASRGANGQASVWYANPDLSKVDAVGWVDLMPASGHGPGGWVNVASIAVYGKPVMR